MQAQESKADYAAILEQLEQEAGGLEPESLPVKQPLMSDRAVQIWEQRIYGAIGGLLLCWVLFVLPNALAFSSQQRTDETSENVRHSALENGLNGQSRHIDSPNENYSSF